MKLKSFITHAAFLMIGIALTASYFIVDILPGTKQYVAPDAAFIKLPNNSEPQNYRGILQDYYLARMYLASPVFFFRRDKGYKMMQKLSDEGYTPATNSLFNYHIDKAYWSRVGKPKLYGEFLKAYKWATIAADQEQYGPISSIVIINTPKNIEETSEAVKILEKAAPESSKDGLAFSLHTYYFKEGNNEKAEHWLNVAQKIWDEKRPEPACTTITPWKGW